MTTETDTVKTEDPSQAPASENRPVHEVEMAQILCGMQTKRTSGGGKKGTESNDKDSETSSSSDDNANANAKAENSIKTEDVRKEDNQASTTTSKGKSTAGKEGKVKVKVNVKSRGNPTSASSDYPVVGPHFRFNAANAGALLPNPEGGNKDLPKLKNSSGASSAQIHPHQPMPPLNWGANANANATNTSTGTGANAGNHAYFNPNNNNQAATNLNGKTPTANGKNTGPDIKPLMAAGSARVTDLDVLLGRGGMTNKHPGNVRFRTLVDSLKPRYIALGSSKKKKKQFSEHLMHTVMEYGGRFLVCHQGKIGVWTEADLATSRKKCSQALREGKTVSAPVKFPDIKLPPNFAAPMPPLLDGTGNVAKIAVASAMANTSIPVVGQAQAQVTSAVSAPGTTATALVTIAPAPAKNPPPPPAAVGPGIESKVSMKDVSSIQQDVPIQPNVAIQQVQPGASGGESSANDTADQISKKRKVEMEEEPSKPAKVPKIEIQKSSNQAQAQAQAQAPPKKFGEAFVESAVGGDVKDGVPEVGLENEHSGEGANENIPLSSAKSPANAIETVPVSINEEMPAKISTPALSHETTKEKSPSNLNEIPKTLETSLPGKNLVEPTKTPDVVMTLPADSPRPAKKSDEITNANTVTSIEEADRARKESHQFFRINEVPILPKVAQTENTLNDSQKTVVSTFQGQDIKDSESVPPSNGIDSSTNPNSNVDAIAQPLSGCQDKMNVCIIPAIPPVTNMNGVDDNGVGPAKTQLQEPSVPGTTGDLNHGDDLNTCLPMPPLATGVIPDKNMPLNNGHMGRVSPIAPSNNGQTTHVPGSDGVPSTYVSIIVANPTQNDVLLGRGGFTNKHDGNIRFRDIVAREKERYNNLGNSKKEKKRFSERIADAVHSYGGRFLVKEKNDWVVAHPSVARKKCSQALRE